MIRLDKNTKVAKLILKFEPDAQPGLQNVMFDGANIAHVNVIAQVRDETGEIIM